MRSFDQVFLYVLAMFAVLGVIPLAVIAAKHRAPILALLASAAGMLAVVVLISAAVMLS